MRCKSAWLSSKPWGWSLAIPTQATRPSCTNKVSAAGLFASMVMTRAFSMSRGAAWVGNGALGKRRACLLRSIDAKRNVSANTLAQQGQAKGSPLCCGGTMMSGKKRRSSRSCGCIWVSSSICVPLSSVFGFSRYSTMARHCAGLAIRNPWRPNRLEQLSCPFCRWSLMECCRCTTPHQATAIWQKRFRSA